MLRGLKVLGILVALVLSLVAVQPAAAACDTTGTVNGTASPTTVTVGDTITFNATGFTPGESVSFWFTTPSGIIVGTPAPIPGGVNSDGTIGPLPLTIQQSLLNLGTGRWAITFQGASSNNVAIMYFCVITTAQATETAQAPPPTNTAVPTTVPPTATTVPATAAPAAPTGSLTVTDQTLSNNSVLVSSVTASQDGWVVVHESNADGSIKLPDIIGKVAVKAGTTTNVSIPLDKQVANGAKLWPMLHIDVGQIGVYEFPGPDVPVVVNGEIVMVPIIVAVAAAPPSAAPTGSLQVTDQTLNNNSVLITSVTASQDGWVVVHESNPDGSILLPGIIGKAAIKAGTTANVSIPLDKQVANGAKLWPMLHIDAGQLGTYEFPGPDVPVVVNGEIVMVPIIVSVAAAPPSAAPTGSLQVTDQLLVNNTVIVSSVTASQDGWVVVHESNPDGSILLPGIIGKTAIKAGTTTNVAIVLDKQVENGAKLWPMLHIEAGQIGVYEFPGPDVPVVVNGEIVMVPIIVGVTPSGVNPGMPTTGQSELPLAGLVALAALGLLSVGWVARRRGVSRAR